MYVPHWSLQCTPPFHRVGQFLIRYVGVFSRHSGHQNMSAGVGLHGIRSLGAGETFKTRCEHRIHTNFTPQTNMPQKHGFVVADFLILARQLGVEAYATKITPMAGGYPLFVGGDLLGPKLKLTLGGHKHALRFPLGSRAVDVPAEEITIMLTDPSLSGAHTIFNQRSHTGVYVEWLARAEDARNHTDGLGCG